MLRVLAPTLKPVNNLILLQYRFDVGGKTRNIAIQLVLQQCCKTSFFIARFTEPWHTNSDR